VTGKTAGGIRANKGQRPQQGAPNRGLTRDGNLASLASLPVFQELGSTTGQPSEFRAKQSRAAEIDRYTTERLPEERSRHSRFQRSIHQGRCRLDIGSAIKQIDGFGI
jgi:hypothetical protein